MLTKLWSIRWISSLASTGINMWSNKLERGIDAAMEVITNNLYIVIE